MFFMHTTFPEYVSGYTVYCVAHMREQAALFGFFCIVPVNLVYESLNHFLHGVVRETNYTRWNDLNVIAKLNFEPYAWLLERIAYHIQWQWLMYFYLRPISSMNGKSVRPSVRHTSFLLWSKRCPIFFKVTRKISRSHEAKIVIFDPIWRFPDCNSNLNSPMAVKWSLNITHNKHHVSVHLLMTTRWSHNNNDTQPNPYMSFCAGLSPG